jgi:hypothetical protein
MQFPVLASTVERVRTISAAIEDRGGDMTRRQSRINQSTLDTNKTDASPMGEKAIEV